MKKMYTPCCRSEIEIQIFLFVYFLVTKFFIHKFLMKFFKKIHIKIFVFRFLTDTMVCIFSMNNSSDLFLLKIYKKQIIYTFQMASWPIESVMVSDPEGAGFESSTYIL